jgi:hypothetical protein
MRRQRFAHNYADSASSCHGLAGTIPYGNYPNVTVTCIFTYFIQGLGHSLVILCTLSSYVFQVSSGPYLLVDFRCFTTIKPCQVQSALLLHISFCTRERSTKSVRISVRAGQCGDSSKPPGRMCKVSISCRHCLLSLP